MKKYYFYDVEGNRQTTHSLAEAISFKRDFAERKVCKEEEKIACLARLEELGINISVLADVLKDESNLED